MELQEMHQQHQQHQQDEASHELMLQRLSRWVWDRLKSIQGTYGISSNNSSSSSITTTSSSTASATAAAQWLRSRQWRKWHARRIYALGHVEFLRVLLSNGFMPGSMPNEVSGMDASCVEH
jgi:hypothetical protein